MSVTKTRTSTLWGAALDWAVATCNALPIKQDPMGFNTGSQAGFWVWDESPNPTYQLIGVDYSPSNKWEQAGPLMVRDDIYPSRYHGCAASNPDKYQAGTGAAWCRGDTPLVAAMRAIVLAKMGDEIDVPASLLNGD